MSCIKYMLVVGYTNSTYTVEAFEKWKLNKNTFNLQIFQIISKFL